MWFILAIIYVVMIFNIWILGKGGLSDYLFDKESFRDYWDNFHPKY